MRRVLVVMVGALALLIPAIPAHADGPYPWHIKNSISSDGVVEIYSGYNCDGTRYILGVNESATSLGWDSIKVYAHPYNDKVYDDVTGNKLADRDYASNHCIDHLSDNDHLILVYYTP